MKRRRRGNAPRQGIVIHERRSQADSSVGRESGAFSACGRARSGVDGTSIIGRQAPIFTPDAPEQTS